MGKQLLDSLHPFGPVLRWLAARIALEVDAVGQHQAAGRQADHGMGKPARRIIFPGPGPSRAGLFDQARAELGKAVEADEKVRLSLLDDRRFDWLFGKLP